ncbi:MAG: adenylate/guanylate cyclase domain-containing protein [Spirochaetales bacterium]|nr:adenylate/guanylate cyclase domain-containing protein [Spirochaetales bacterium]
MKTNSESTATEIEHLIAIQVNATLKKGSLAAALMAFGSTIPLYLSMQLGISHGIEVPILWTMIGGIYSLLVYILARRGKIQGIWKYAAMMGFATIPTTIYVMAFFLLPAGTATYLNGPAGYLYFFLIVITGFSFDFRLSLWTGIFAATQYLLAIFLSLPQVALIAHPDPYFKQDLTEPMFYFFRPLMIVMTGLTVGYIGLHVKQLIIDSIQKEQEKNTINRLFGLYVSPEIREKVTASTDSAGEKKKLAVLFCDIRDFTSHSENKPPEDLVAELNEYFTSMAEAIVFESGTIDKFIGDAVMAVFGGAIPLENPCQNALNAAIHMQRNLKRLNENRAARGMPPIRNGIGLHYGEVFIGSIGSAERKDYTVIGDAVNVAARIESLCKEYGNGLLFSQEVYLSLAGDIQKNCRFLAETTVKGRKEAVAIYGL